MKTFKSRTSGFTLIEIMIVVVLIGMLAAIALPNWVRARTNSQTTTCINNLRQIDAAKQQWAMETRQATNALPEVTDLTPFLKRLVVCPSGGFGATLADSYTINDVATKPSCQISGSTHFLPQDTTN